MHNCQDANVNCSSKEQRTFHCLKIKAHGCFSGFPRGDVAGTPKVETIPRISLVAFWLLLSRFYLAKLCSARMAGEQVRDP